MAKIIAQLSLAHPEVGFDFVLQNRLYFSFPPLLAEKIFSICLNSAPCPLEPCICSLL